MQLPELFLVSRKLLMALCDQKPHSLQSLCGVLAVDAKEILEQLDLLETQGAQIFQSGENVFRLGTNIEFIDESLIYALLDDCIKPLISRISIEWTVDSTSDFCIDYAKRNKDRVYVCIAEHQTRGRGRRGRDWISPLGENLYFSLFWPFGRDAPSMEGFSLSVATIVAEVLKTGFGFDGVRLKWPNDIYCANKKVGGILVDVTGDISGSFGVIIGIGINISMGSVLSKKISREWTDIFKETGKKISRNELAAKILNSLIPALYQYKTDGFLNYKNRWSEFALYLGEAVVMRQHSDIGYVGRFVGVSTRGELVLDVAGELMLFNAGDVSLFSG